jgi:hypothetical protein
LHRIDWNNINIPDEITDQIVNGLVNTTHNCHAFGTSENYKQEGGNGLWGGTVNTSLSVVMIILQLKLLLPFTIIR